MTMSKWFVFKKGYRTFTKNRKKTVSILLLMAFSIGFGAALLDLQDVRSILVNNSIKATNFADGFIFLDPTPQPDVLTDLKQFSGEFIKNYEMRMIMLIDFQINSSQYEGLLVGINTSLDTHINSLVNEVYEDIEEYEFCLNWNFAQEKNIRKGQEITLKLGITEITEEIKEIGFNPEFLYTPLYDYIAFPSLKPYPVFYVDLKYINDNFIQQSDLIVNQLIYDLLDNSTQNEIENAINNQMGGYVNKIIPQDDYPFVKTSREDEIQDRQFMMIFILIFIIGALITLILVIFKLIHNDLKSISVFQGLGAKKREIIGAYLIFNLMLVLISMLIGFCLNIMVNLPINMLITENLGIPNYNLLFFNISNQLLIGTIILSISLFSTYIIIKKTFKMDVQRTLKKEVEFLKKTNIIERIALRLKKNLHPFTKYNLRRIFGKKLFLSFIILSLTLSFCIIILSYGYPDSMQYSVDKKLNEIEKWDAVSTTWIYENETNIDNLLESIPDIDFYEFGISDIVSFSKQDSNFKDSLKIMAFQNNSELHELKAENRVKIKFSDEILISKDLISEYNLKVGDYIYLKSGNNSQKFKIIGTVNDMVLETAFISITTAQELVGEINKINMIYFTSDLTLDNAIDKVQDLTQIQYVIRKEALREEFNALTEMILVVFLIIGIILTIFGLFLMAIVLKAIVEYRMEDYANMKALGIQNSEIRKSLFLEITFYLIISLICGISLGIFITRQVIYQYSFILPKG